MDQLDALVGLRTGAADVVDTHVGAAAGVTADDQLVGGGVVAGQDGVEDDHAIGAAEVASHVEGMEGGAVAEGDRAVAEAERADRGVAGQVPGRGIQRHAGDVAHGADDAGAVGQRHIHRAAGGVDNVAVHPRVLDIQVDVRIGCVNAQQVAVTADQFGTITEVETGNDCSVSRIEFLLDVDTRPRAALHPGSVDVYSDCITCNRGEIILGPDGVAIADDRASVTGDDLPGAHQEQAGAAVHAGGCLRMPLQMRCIQNQVSTQLYAGSDSAARKRAAREGSGGTWERTADQSRQCQRSARRIDHSGIVHRHGAVAKADANGARRIDRRAVKGHCGAVGGINSLRSAAGRDHKGGIVE